MTGRAGAIRRTVDPFRLTRAVIPAAALVAAQYSSTTSSRVGGSAPGGSNTRCADVTIPVGDIVRPVEGWDAS
ncbi:MAG: hypothetical protein HYX95_01485 [Chloroflexi bacterium]|nr:hypothetical protein [Chloroflexota bacterium]